MATTTQRSPAPHVGRKGGCSLSEEDTESIYSIQGYETAIAHDTTDTDTKSEYSDSDVFEYEVASLSENEENPLVNSASSSGCEDNLFGDASVSAIAAVICGSSVDITSVTGSEDSNGSIDDVVLNCTDFWTCVQCKSQNTNPHFRYCQKCFQMRKTWLPPRPRGFRRKAANKYSKPLDSGVGSSQESTASGKAVLEALDFAKIEVPSFATSRKRKLQSDESDIESSKEVISVKKSCNATEEVKTSKKRTHEDDEDAGPSKKVKADATPADNLCIICHSAPKNSIFIHKKVAHCGCCYKCARRTWRNQKWCPVCRGKIHKVMLCF